MFVPLLSTYKLPIHSRFTEACDSQAFIPTWRDYVSNERGRKKGNEHHPLISKVDFISQPYILIIARFSEFFKFSFCRIESMSAASRSD